LQHELGRFQLEWGQKAGHLIDSGHVAQTLHQLMPAEQRVVAPRPAFEGDAPSEPSGASDMGDDVSEPAVPQALPPEPSAAMSAPIHVVRAKTVPPVSDRPTRDRER